MKYLLFTHNDLDGVGCDIAFRTYFKNKDIYVSHSGIDEVDNRLAIQINNPENNRPLSNITPYFE